MISLLICLLVCIIDSVIPAIDGLKYGKIEQQFFYHRMILFFFPAWILIFLTIYLYYKIIKEIKSDKAIQDNLRDSDKLRRKLMMYPIIIIICNAPYTIKALLETNGYKEDTFYFTMISGIFRSINGFLNAFIYGFTDAVKRKICNCSNYKFQRSDQSLAYFHKK